MPISQSHPLTCNKFVVSNHTKFCVSYFLCYPPTMWTFGLEIAVQPETTFPAPLHHGGLFGILAMESVDQLPSQGLGWKEIQIFFMYAFVIYQGCLP